jgi:hypothetical protein
MCLVAPLTPQKRFPFRQIKPIGSQTVAQPTVVRYGVRSHLRHCVRCPRCCGLRRAAVKRANTRQPLHYGAEAD